ncbi:hypothetical protein CONLIGDRAFT_650844 [Coniochaeta ligniaria NRRL 30616]|uniref:Apple domain-containing protein n=1 Tax=Coniochaeta ligniaria NRRL 30616 TaxID=1408157 RepID=A0A1J7JLL8_9PEZI|nr:hypothetical protein CONLIGDRAFT_650844 [Coniochaeta ligniaria NRRL 30616]
MHGLEVVQPGLEPVFYPQYQNYSHIAEEDRKRAPRERRVFGFRKVTFWLVAALAALSIIAVGVPVGLGVGLSRAQGDKGTDPTTTPGGGTPSSKPTGTVTVIMTTTAPGATPTPSSSSTSSSQPASSKTTSTLTTNPTVISACPQGNNTVVTPTLGTVNYRILCDRDFDGAKEDLASVVMPSLDACMNLCNTMNYFQKRTDVGCTYNVAGTGTQTPGTCWCLGGETKIIVTNVGNQIAVPM